MPPTALTYRPMSLRCLTLGGRVVGGCKITPPKGRKWLKFNENGARVAGNQKARPVSRLRGAGVPSGMVCFFMAKRDKCIITITI